MTATTWRPDRNMPKFWDLVGHCERQVLSAVAPDELLGCSQRHFRRYRANSAAAQRPYLKPVLRPAALFTALIILANCSAVPAEDAAEPTAPPNYGVLVSNTLKGFKDFPSYGNFEISGLRWVHVATGWNWLTCVRYDDHGHRRTYSFFIKDNVVVNGRYDTATDECPAQKYAPLDVTTGAIRSAAPEPRQPLY
jgi:hypothetical protein